MARLYRTKQRRAETVERFERMRAEVGDHVDDPEVAHVLEDRMRRAALAFINEWTDDATVRRVTELALDTDGENFERWSA